MTARASASAAAAQGWSLALRFGALLAAIGLLDLALAWLPRLGNERIGFFGIVSGGADALPLLTLGSGAVLAAAFALDRPSLLRVTGLVLLAISLLIFANLALFALEVPRAVASTEEQPLLALLGVRRLVLRTAGFALISGLGHFVGGFVALYAGIFGRPAPIL
jgi:hypothetical protein